MVFTFFRLIWGGGGGTLFTQSRSLSLWPSTLASYNAGTDHVGFSPTKQASRAPSARRREAFSESLVLWGKGGFDVFQVWLFFCFFFFSCFFLFFLDFFFFFSSFLVFLT